MDAHALPRWRILIVDDERDTALEHYQNLRDEQEGRFEFFFAGEEGQQGEALVEDAKKKAREHRCHLALVDMRLLDGSDRTDYSGLYLMPMLKPTESIIVTGFAYKARISEMAREQGARHVVDKGDPNELRKVVRETLKECGYRDTEINWKATLNELRIARHLFPENPSLFRCEAEDVLRKLFDKANGLDVTPLDTVDDPLSLTLRPGSLVVKVTETGKELPYLVKIGRSGRIETEVSNYDNHIRMQGPGAAPVAPLKTCSLWSLGGTVYTYVGNFTDQHPTLFSDWYKVLDRNIKEIENVLCVLYEQWQGHYHRKSHETSYAALIYNDVWNRNKDGEKWLARLVGQQDLYSDLKVPSSLSCLSLPNPVDWLITRLSVASDGTFLDPTTQPASLSITHGDMHGDNFFVTRHSSVWVIDYERTGEGHVLQDWVELEHDILTRLTLLQPEEWQYYVRLTCAIAQPYSVRCWPEGDLNSLSEHIIHSQAVKSLRVIDIIRGLARKSDGGTGDARPYVWGLLLNAVFRIMIWQKEYDEPRLPEERSGKYAERRQKLYHGIQRCLVLAGILCHRLDNWNSNPWPPKEWKSLLHDQEADQQKIKRHRSNCIVIVTVNEKEATAVLAVFHHASDKIVQREHKGKKTYYRLPDIGKMRVYMVQSEMGNTEPGAARATVDKAIRDLRPGAVIMCGVAYGLQPKKQRLGDVLVSKQILNYEVQKVDTTRGVISRGSKPSASELLLDRFRSGALDWRLAPVHYGLILSGEKLVNDKPFRDHLLKDEPEAIGGEMEGFGLYAAAQEAKKDWILVKAICDWADGRKNDDAQLLAARNAAEFVKHVLETGGF